MSSQAAPIGVFDSGYGGLTVFKEIAALLPQYDYIYLGDNARAPYGSRSFDTVYKYTRECVDKLFAMGCKLVILACNTASAKALRSIQQNDLPKRNDYRRVLGVIRPTTEIIGTLSATRQVGVLATPGTVASQSYVIESLRFFPELKVFQQACPIWATLVENNEHENAGADYFIKKNVDMLLSQSPDIDTIVLACTHYPLIYDRIKSFVPEHVRLVSQGPLVAQRLAEYLQRHPEMESLCSKNGTRSYFTTESSESFDEKASIFLGFPVTSKHIEC